MTNTEYQKALAISIEKLSAIEDELKERQRALSLMKIEQHKIQKQFDALIKYKLSNKVTADVVSMQQVKKAS